MDEKIKKQLEEMAEKCALDMGELKREPVFTVDRHLGNPQQYEYFKTRNTDAYLAFKQGAQAAWDLCQKHERERIYKDVEAGLAQLAVTLRNSKSRSELQAICEHDACLIASGYLKSIILNPPAPQQQGE